MGKFVTIPWVKKIKTPVNTAAANCLKIGLNNEKLTYLLATTITNTELIETEKEAAATPLKPKNFMKNNVKTHVVTVQKIIKQRVIFTFPIAFRKLVRGVEIEEKNVLKEKKTREIIAGSHF